MSSVPEENPIETERLRVVFRCPYCGSTRGVAESISCVSLFPITSVLVPKGNKPIDQIVQDYIEVSFEPEVIDDRESQFRGYFCLACNSAVPLTTSESRISALLAWLAKNGMLVRESEFRGLWE